MVKEKVLEEFKRIKNGYMESDVVMGELLATHCPMLDNFSVEDYFDLYVLCMKWANDDRFFIQREDEKLTEL